jgi:hypothetical protein
LSEQQLLLLRGGHGHSSDPDVSPGKILPAVKRMHTVEVGMLASLIRRDDLAREWVDHEDWDNVAIRWNSLAQQLMTGRGRAVYKHVYRTLHFAHGDTIRHAVLGLQRREEHLQQHGFIHEQVEAAARGLHYDEPVLAKDVPFIPYEDEQLTRMAFKFNRCNVSDRAQHTGKKIRWTEVVGEWSKQCAAEKEGKKEHEPRLHARNKAVLKTRWNTIKDKVKAERKAKAEKEKAEAAAAATAAGDMTSSASESTIATPHLPAIHSTTSTSSSSFSSSSAASSNCPEQRAAPSSPAASSSSASSSSPAPHVSVKQSPSKRLLQSVVASMSSAVHGVGPRQLFGAAAAAGVEPTVNRPSGRCSNDSSSTETAPPAAAAAAASAAVTAATAATLPPAPSPPSPPPPPASGPARLSASYHWSVEETNYYLYLCEQSQRDRKKKLSYKVFQAAWPPHFTPRTEQQFYAKNRHIMQKDEKDAAGAHQQVAGGSGSGSGKKKEGNGRPRLKKQQQQLTSRWATDPRPLLSSHSLAWNGKRQSPQTDKGKEYQAERAAKRQRVQQAS